MHDNCITIQMWYMSVFVPNILGMKLMCQDYTLSSYYPALAIATKFTCDQGEELGAS